MRILPKVKLLVLSFMIIAATNIAINIPFASVSPAYAQQASFSNPIPIDNGPGDQTDPHIAGSLSGNNVYASYTSEINGASNILFARSSDGGASFSTPHISLSTNGFSFLSDVAAGNGDDVYVVWTNVTTVSGVYLAKSTDGGVTFGNPIQVEHGGDGRTPRVAVSGDNVYVVWQDFTTSPSSLEPEIFGAVSTDGGQTFGDPVDISNTAGTRSQNPSIAVSGDNVYVVWTDCNPNGTNCEIFYSKSNDAGISFTTPLTLSDPESTLPDVSVQGNTVYIVYGRLITTQNIPNRDIFLIKGTDSSTGATVFGNTLNLSNDPQTSNHPRIATSGNNLVIQWEDRNQTALVPHWDVVAAGSTDGGATFGSRTSATSNSFPTSDSTLNDVAVSGSNIYSTWTVFENNNYNVYFARGTLMHTSPVEGIQKLIDTINSLPIAKGIKTSLNGPLHNAINLLNDNDPTNDADVCSKLDSFLLQVNAKEANGQLTPQQAADLRQQATAIETSLGCSSSAATATPTTTFTTSNNQESTSSVPLSREHQQEQALTNLRNQAENNALSSMTK
jgi:hypothetical protein